MSAHRWRRLAGVALAGMVVAAAGQDGLEVTADEMSSQGDLTEFRGAVVIAGERLELAADLVQVDAKAGTYAITGSPAAITLRDPAATVTVTAPTISYAATSERASLAGGAQLTRGGLTVTASSLEYDAADAGVAARGSVTLRLDDAMAHGTLLMLTAADAGQDLRLEGTPASVRLQVGDETLHASAATIEHLASGKLRLRGDAAATLGGESLSGADLSYDLAAGGFTATPQEGGRVRAVISLP